MTSVVTCPRCGSQLGGPPQGPWPARAACPICTAEFAIVPEMLRRLPPIRAVEEPPQERHDDPVHDDPVHDDPVHDDPVHDDPVHDDLLGGDPLDGVADAEPSEDQGDWPPADSWRQSWARRAAGAAVAATVLAAGGLLWQVFGGRGVEPSANRPTPLATSRNPAPAADAVAATAVAAPTATSAADDGEPASELPAGAAATVSRTAHEEVRDSGAAAASGGTWQSTPLVGLLQDPSWASADDLATAVEAGDAALATWEAARLDDGASAARKGRAYKTLCELAAALTLLEPIEFNAAVVQRQAEGLAVLRRAWQPVDGRGDLARISAQWWGYAERPSAGIFLVGRVRDLRAWGRWTEYAMELSIDAEQVVVPVLMDDMQLSTGEEAAIVGIVVEHPQQRLRDYNLETPGDLETPRLVLAAEVEPLNAVPRPGSLPGLDRIRRPFDGALLRPEGKP